MGTFAYYRKLADQYGYKYTPGNGTDIFERDNVVIIRDGLAYMIRTLNGDHSSDFQTTVCSGLENAFLTARRYLINVPDGNVIYP